MRSRIMVVGRDIGLRADLARLLGHAGYRVELAENAAHAGRIGFTGIELALVAPDGLGPEGRGLIQELRATIGRVLLVASSGAARDPRSDIIDATDEPSLLARVAEQLAPTQEAAAEEPVLTFAGYRLDFGGHTLHNATGVEVALTHSEFGLLRVFVQRAGRVLSREQLLQLLAGRDAESYDRSIDMQIVRLRRKIEPDPKRPRLIVTVPNSGYKFAAKISEAGAADAPVPVPAVQETAPERRHIIALSAELVPMQGGSLPDDPEDLSTVIAAFRRHAAVVLTRYGGVIGDRRGRGLVAWFGFPIAQEHAAGRALHAGLLLVEHHAEADAVIPPGFSIRVGVASGLVVANAAGEILGETPREAERLRELAEPGQVTLAAGVRRLAGELFAYRELGPPDAEGGARPTHAWQVLAPLAVASHSEALYADRLPRLIGREDELSSLLSAWQTAKHGEGRLVLLSGEPGIGKSRLLAALQEHLADEPHVGLHYFCSPLHQDSSLHPVIARIEHEAGFARGEPADERLHKLEALLAPTNPPPEDVVLIASMLSITADDRYPRLDLSPQRRKERTFAALRRRLASLSRSAPVLLLFEDVHWADPSSLELLDGIIEEAAELPVLLVVSYRPEFVLPWLGRAGTRQIALGRLSRRQSAMLAAQVGAEHPLSLDLQERIVAQTDGVPLFIEELTKAVQESSNGSPGAFSQLTVPSTLHASLIARLDRLPIAKQVAQIGAAIGREFSFGLLAATGALPAAQLADGLDQLVASGLAFRRGTSEDAVYVFKHALVRDAMYETLLRSRRQDLHARIADAMERRFVDVAEQQPAVVAQHLAHAGSIAQAVVYWGKAGRRSAAQSALAEAVAQFNRGLELLSLLPESMERHRQELELQSTLAGALVASRGLAAPETGRAYTRARALCEQLGDYAALFPVLSGQFSTYLGRGEYTLARQIAEELLRLAEAHGDPASQMVANRSMGMCLHVLGDFTGAVAHFEKVLALYDPQTHRALATVAAFDLRAVTLANLSWDLFILGYQQQAGARSEEALTWARELNHPHTMLYVQIAAGFLHRFRGDEAAAETAVEEVMRLAAPRNLRVWLSPANVLRGRGMVARGEVAAGLALAREGMVEKSAQGTVLNLPYFLALFAECCAAAGELTEASQLRARALHLADTADERWFEAELHRLGGDLALSGVTAQPDEAEHWYHRAIEVAQRQGAKTWELRSAVRLGRLWSGRGKFTATHDLLAPIVGWFTKDLEESDLIEAKHLMHGLSENGDSERRESGDGRS